MKVDQNQWSLPLTLCFLPTSKQIDICKGAGLDHPQLALPTCLEGRNVGCNRLERDKLKKSQPLAVPYPEKPRWILSFVGFPEIVCNLSA